MLIFCVFIIVSCIIVIIIIIIIIITIIIIIIYDSAFLVFSDNLRPDTPTVSCRYSAIKMLVF